MAELQHRLRSSLQELDQLKSAHATEVLALNRRVHELQARLDQSAQQAQEAAAAMHRDASLSTQRQQELQQELQEAQSSIAALNAQIEVLKKEGISGIKKFSRNLRNERRIRPDKVLELKRSVYGIPDAGQSFSMFMQSLHLKKCGMVQSEMDPCLFYKILEEEKGAVGVCGKVVDYLIAITWVDDCRYLAPRSLSMNMSNKFRPTANALWRECRKSLYQ